MTAAGMTVLSLCREHLKGPIEDDVNEALELGLEWLNANFSPTKNFGAGSNAWFNYYTYGIERVGALLGVDELGGQDWYREISRNLLMTQGGKGQWSDAWGRPHSTTCYSLLFLNRATAAASTGPGAKVLGKLYGVDERTFLRNALGELGHRELGDLQLPRHALHNHSLTFAHPRTGEELRIECPLAPDLRVYLDRRALAD